jgi:2'-5' RNA ligase
MHRLFVALQIPPEIKDLIRQARNTLVRNSQEYRWEKDEKIHLTLKFLGDVPGEKLAAVTNAIDHTVKSRPFECRLTSFGFFFRQRTPAILYAALETPPELNQLVEQLNNRLAEFGIKKEKRDFKPHLTILRIKKSVPQAFIEAFDKYTFNDVGFQADTITLYESKLLRQGSVYTALKTIKLEE